MALTDAEESAVVAHVIQFATDNQPALIELAKQKETAVPKMGSLDAKSKKFLADVLKVKDAKTAWDKAEDVKTATKHDLHNLCSDYIGILEGIVGKTTQMGRQLSDIRSKLRRVGKGPDKPQ